MGTLEVPPILGHPPMSKWCMMLATTVVAYNQPKSFPTVPETWC